MSRSDRDKAGDMKRIKLRVLDGTTASRPQITNPPAIADLLARAEEQAAAENKSIAPDEALAKLSAEGIELVDASDFLAQELSPPKWLVADFIAQGMKGDLCGSSKTFKTYLGLQFSICVAAGKDFLGAYRINQPHVVAYFNLELFDWNFQERMAAQMSGVTEDAAGDLCSGLAIDREALRGKLIVGNLRGRASELRDNLDPLVSVLRSKKVEMIVLDPRYKLLRVGEDENSIEGLRGILEMRDALAEHFAVMLVTHDPKGDTAQKKTTDRGAGSYAAGADFDFRLTIDRASGWTKDDLVYVVESEGRARKTPPAIAVRFGASQIFTPDDTVLAIKDDGRIGTRNNASGRAVNEVAMQDCYRRAAVQVATEAGADLLDTDTFDNLVARVPGASVGINRRPHMRKMLVSQGVLASCRELERKAQTGAVGSVKNGRTFVGLPDHVAAYRARFENLGL